VFIVPEQYSLSVSMYGIRIMHKPKDEALFNQSMMVPWPNDNALVLINKFALLHWDQLCCHLHMVKQCSYGSTHRHTVQYYPLAHSTRWCL